MLRAFAIVFALIAFVCLVVATAGMVTGRQSARAGTLIRLAAVVSFAIAVALNVAAH